MSKMKEIDDIAQGIADVTKELMYDSIHWQIAEFHVEGDSYNDLHDHVMYLAIKKCMNKSKKKRKFSHHKIKLMEIEAIEREYWIRYNSNIPKWQQDMY